MVEGDRDNHAVVAEPTRLTNQSELGIWVPVNDSWSVEFLSHEAKLQVRQEVDDQREVMLEETGIQSR